MNDFFLHPQGICESASIGPGTRIWAFAHVLPGAAIGANCNICDHVFIENDVVVGNRVTVKCGVQLWDGLRVADDVFIGPNATFTNDKHPRSKQFPSKFAVTTLRRGCSVGANATILPGVTLGEGAMVGAGAVVTKDVPPWAIVTGNPARIVGFVGAEDPGEPKAEGASRDGEVRSSEVEGVRLIRLPQVIDPRGNLTAGERPRDLPFEVRRFFLVYDVPCHNIRGEHAHKECHQLLFCVRGACRVMVDDGRRRADVLLQEPQLGLYIPPAFGPLSTDTRGTLCFWCWRRTLMTQGITFATMPTLRRKSAATARKPTPALAGLPEERDREVSGTLRVRNPKPNYQ